MIRHLAFAALAAALTSSVFAQEADLSVAKSGPAIAAANSDVTYMVTVSNLGPDDAVAVTLNDNTPGTMTFVSVSQTSGPTFTCSDPGVGNSGLVSCTIALLPASVSADFNLVFHIPTGTPAGTDFTNIATVGTQTFDPNSENDTAVAVTSTPPPPVSDMSVSKTGPAAAGPNTDVAYTISVSNAGPDAASTVSWQDVLPGTMTFVSIVQNSGPPMSCGESAGTVTCTAASFPAGLTATFTLTGHIPTGTASGTTYQNTATVSTTTIDSSSENNSSSAVTTVSAADIAVTKNGPGTATAGTQISYVLVITNNGPDSATNAALHDALPPGTTFASINQDTGPSANCQTPLAGTNGPVDCTIATLANGASAQFTVTVNVGNTTSITNTVVGGSDQFDPDTGDNSSSVTTTVTPVANLGVVKSGPGSVTAGTNITYTITVTNAGPSDASNVSLSDPLPPNTSFVSMTQTVGPTFNCTGSNCTIALFPAGATATFTLVLHVAPSATGSVANTATVMATTSDPDGNDNSSTTTATVATSADVSVAKSGPPNAVSGTNATYTVTVTNNGPSDAANVSVTDTPGANLTFVSMTQTTGPVFSCVAQTCTIATLAAGATAMFDVVVAVAPAATGTVSNSAAVSTTTSDPNAANNSATATTPVNTPPTDVRIVKTAGAPRYNPGTNATYTLAVTNLGPATAIGVTVTDVLPPGSTFVSAMSTQGTCSGTTTVTCTVGTLAPSAGATITLVITVPSTVGNLSNTATVTETNTDTNPANNTSTATVLVAPPEIPTLSPLVLALLAVALAAVALMRR